MKVFFQIMVSICLASSLAACSCGWGREIYDQGQALTFYEQDTCTPYSTTGYYTPSFYHVPYSDVYQY